MANNVKTEFLKGLRYYGPLHKLGRSQSLYEIGNGVARVYIRYSKVHPNGRAFYGLRAEDLSHLEGHPSVLCFLWDSQDRPLIVPYEDYEQVFQSVSPASDGQFKVQAIFQESGDELYIAQAGRFSVAGNLGWEEFEALIDTSAISRLPELSHSQMQTLLGAIGDSKKYDLWIPPNDRASLDWSISGNFECTNELPPGYESIQNILRQVDVIWIQPGSNEIAALFEVEHSTPMYGALLRFNDIHLVAPAFSPRFSIVSNDARKSLFARHLDRPTFRASGLNRLCTFLEYANVYSWHSRIQAGSTI